MVKTYTVSLFKGPTASVAKQLKTSIHEASYVAADVVLKTDYDQLQYKYDELLKESLELSKFYGDITNWESGDDYVNSIIDITDMERIENIIEGADCSDDFGGKRARDFLRKWDKK